MSATLQRFDKKGSVVSFNLRPITKRTLVAVAACLAMPLGCPIAIAQARQVCPAPPSTRALFTADAQAQMRTYHLDDADADVPYCVFASSKISKTKSAPFIVSLHGFGAGPQIMCNKTASPVIRLGARRGLPGARPDDGSAATATSAPAQPPGPSDQDVQNGANDAEPDARACPLLEKVRVIDDYFAQIRKDQH